jgi:hypothetical protein
LEVLTQSPYGRGSHATSIAELSCRKKESLRQAQKHATHRNVDETQSSTRVALADREFEGLSQSLANGFKLTKLIKDDEIAYRYLVE